MIENQNPLVQVDCSTYFNHHFSYEVFFSCTIKGVLFSVPRFHRYIKKSTPKSRVTMGAAVYTAAVVCNISFIYLKLFIFLLEIRLNI